MSAKEPSAHPSCNRAFALRMMNPTSYAEERISVFDREIQPVLKKPIAKSVDYNTDYRRQSSDTITIDDGKSISTSSSDASFSEMELYDIDEIENENYEDDFGMIRQHSSLESYGKNKNNPKLSKASRDGDRIFRSHSSADGFDRYFARNTGSRATTPGRIRSQSKNNNNGDINIKQTNFRAEAITYLKDKSHNEKSGSSLRRSRSLKNEQGNGARITVGVLDPEKGKEKQKTPLKIRVTATRSSQLRAKLHDAIQTPPTTPGKSLTKANLTKVPNHQKMQRRGNNFVDDCSESESSVFSLDLDSQNNPPRPRPNPRSSNRITSPNSRTNSRQSPHHTNANTNSSKASKKRDLSNQESKNQASSMPISSVFYTETPPHRDTFGSRLSELCHLISERHPGDFQILETLVEMQSAYEERNDLVKNTISCLKNKIRALENKLSKTPNIPGLVIPLMRATNAFQTQLQNIINSQDSPPQHNVAIQFPELLRNDRELSMEEISAEANSVAKEIETLSVNISPKKSTEVFISDMNRRSKTSQNEEASEESDSFVSSDRTRSESSMHSVNSDTHENEADLQHDDDDDDMVVRNHEIQSRNDHLEMNGLTPTNGDISNGHLDYEIIKNDVIPNGVGGGGGGDVRNGHDIKNNNTNQLKISNKENNLHNPYDHGNVKQVTTDAALTAIAIENSMRF